MAAIHPLLVMGILLVVLLQQVTRRHRIRQVLALVGHPTLATWEVHHRHPNKVQHNHSQLRQPQVKTEKSAILMFPCLTCLDSFQEKCTLDLHGLNLPWVMEPGLLTLGVSLVRQQQLLLQLPKVHLMEGRHLIPTSIK